MKIYTSYFAQLKKLSENIIPIAICGKEPSWYTGLCYKKLAPKYDWWIQWKNEHHNNYIYALKYKETVLDQLCVEEVLQDLESLSNGADVVLLCYEKADAFCHRHLVSDWLHSYNIDCEELVFGGKNV